MRNTEQTLNTAIGELRCVRPGVPASLSELTALSAAHSSIDELVRSCVVELRADLQHPASWSDIAYALGATSPDAARQRFGSGVIRATAAEDDQIRAFWAAFANRFTWDFLPAGFLYALYLNWMRTALPQDLHQLAFTRVAFTRRLKGPATASGEWKHLRSRPGSLMKKAEPLEYGLPQWARDDTDAAVHGFRRRSSQADILRSAPAPPVTVHANEQELAQ